MRLYILNQHKHREQPIVPYAYPPHTYTCEGHRQDPERKIAYLVWKWILAEADIPMDAEYLGQWL